MFIQNKHEKQQILHSVCILRSIPTILFSNYLFIYSLETFKPLIGLHVHLIIQRKEDIKYISRQFGLEYVSTPLHPARHPCSHSPRHLGNLQARRSSLPEILCPISIGHGDRLIGNEEGTSMDDENCKSAGGRHCSFGEEPTNNGMVRCHISKSYASLPKSLSAFIYQH